MNTKLINKNLFWILLALLVTSLDRFTKFLVVKHLPLGEPVSVLPFFSFYYTSNTGAAFSFLDRPSHWQIWIFAAIAVIVSIFLIIWILRLSGNKVWLGIALAMILGGTMGNLYDRLFYHYVIDFLLFFVSRWSWPAFNVADAAISTGAVMLIVDIFCHEKYIKKNINRC